MSPVQELFALKYVTSPIVFRSTYSPEESAKIMANEDKETVEADLKINGEFYKAFNTWLEQARTR